MRRLISEGIFEREGEGRDAVFRATAAGRSLLGVTQQRHLLAYAQDAAGRGWDRRWRLVSFAIPESQRSARDAFRDHLLALGGAGIQPGVYVSPHHWEDDIPAEVDRLGIAEHVTLASTDDLRVGGTTDPRQIVAELWPLDDLGEAVPVVHRHLSRRAGTARGDATAGRAHRRARLPGRRAAPGDPVQLVLRVRPAAATRAAAPPLAGPGGAGAARQVPQARRARPRGQGRTSAVPRLRRRYRPPALIRPASTIRRLARAAERIDDSRA